MVCSGCVWVTIQLWEHQGTAVCVDWRQGRRHISMRSLEALVFIFVLLHFFKSFFFCTHQDMQGFTHLFTMLADSVMWLVLCSLNDSSFYRDNLSTAFNIHFYLVGWVLSCSVLCVDCGEKTRSAGSSSENRDVWQTSWLTELTQGRAFGVKFVYHQKDRGVSYEADLSS